MKQVVGGRFSWVSLAGSMLLALAAARPAAAACDADGTQASGAVYRICMPPAGSWNGDLVIWAHGYVAFNEPIAIPEDQLRLPDGTLLPDLINLLGYAFATTSYSANGTAVREGLADVADLVQVFKAQKGEPRKTFITGASEGGLITALAVEQYPDLFAGGVAACGPIGTFRGQVNYFGDFRAVFDYFYPGLLPGEPDQIPDELIANFEPYWEGVIKPIVLAPANQARTRELMTAAFVPADPANFWATAEKSLRDGLWYSTFATNDIIEKLGGQPFDNTRRIYYGTSNDFLINILIRRLTGDPAAFAEMLAHYDTTGQITRPLITLQTSLDQQVPAWHQDVYTLKAYQRGTLANLIPLRVKRYGHCNFTAGEVVVSFALMVLKAEGYFDTARMEKALAVPSTRAEFRRLARHYKIPAKPRRR